MNYISNRCNHSIIKGFHNPFINPIVALSPQSTQSTSELWGLIPMIPPGRGSGRINPEYHQRLSHSVQSVGLTIPKSQPCLPRSVPFDFLKYLWLTHLTVLKMKRSGLLRFWGDVALSLRVGLDCYYIFSLWVAWLFPYLSLSYLHITSICNTIRGIKSLSPPNQSLATATREGNKSKITLGLPTFQDMPNVTHIETNRQSGYFEVDRLINFPSIHKNKLAIKRLTHRV